MAFKQIYVNKITMNTIVEFTNVQIRIGNINIGLSTIGVPNIKGSLILKSDGPIHTFPKHTLFFYFITFLLW